MTARFRQVAPFDGVDEGVGPLQAAAIVPLGGSSLVFLEGGSNLHVASDVPSQALVTEIKSFTGGDLQSFLNNLGANVALIASVSRLGRQAAVSNFGARARRQKWRDHSREESQNGSP